jgi:hypothetical protein
LTFGSVFLTSPRNLLVNQWFFQTRASV